MNQSFRIHRIHHFQKICIFCIIAGNRHIFFLRIPARCYCISSDPAKRISDTLSFPANSRYKRINFINPHFCRIYLFKCTEHIDKLIQSFRRFFNTCFLHIFRIYKAPLTAYCIPIPRIAGIKSGNRIHLSIRRCRCLHCFILAFQSCYNIRGQRFIYIITHRKQHLSIHPIFHNITCI